MLGLAGGAGEGVDVAVGGDVTAGREFRSPVGRERLLVDDLAGELQPFPELLAVVLGLQVVEPDGGRLERVDRTQAHVAPARGPHLADMGLKAVCLLGHGAVVVHGDRDEMVLDVRELDPRPAAEIAARLEQVRGRDAGFRREPLEPDLELAPRRGRSVERDRFDALVLDRPVEMVLQVLAHARQVVRHGDAERPRGGPRGRPRSAAGPAAN